MASHTCNINTEEAKAGGLLQVQGQLRCMVNTKTDKAMVQSKVLSQKSK